jgi:hypothetical protein
MGEASPIGSVLHTKPASSLELYTLEINKHALTRDTARSKTSCRTSSRWGCSVGSIHRTVPR